MRATLIIKGGRLGELVIHDRRMQLRGEKDEQDEKARSAHGRKGRFFGTLQALSASQNDMCKL